VEDVLPGLAGVGLLELLLEGHGGVKAEILKAETGRVMAFGLSFPNGRDGDGLSAGERDIVWKLVFGVGLFGNGERGRAELR
jgi:hypothetical protein